MTKIHFFKYILCHILRYVLNIFLRNNVKFKDLKKSFEIKKIKFTFIFFKKRKIIIFNWKKLEKFDVLNLEQT